MSSRRWEGFVHEHQVHGQSYFKPVFAISPYANASARFTYHGYGEWDAVWFVEQNWRPGRILTIRDPRNLHSKMFRSDKLGYRPLPPKKLRHWSSAYTLPTDYHSLWDHPRFALPDLIVNAFGIVTPFVRFKTRNLTDHWVYVARRHGEFRAAKYRTMQGAFDYLARGFEPSPARLYLAAAGDLREIDPTL